MALKFGTGHFKGQVKQINRCGQGGASDSQTRRRGRRVGQTWTSRAITKTCAQHVLSQSQLHAVCGASGWRL